ncbi:hypothetical protein QTG54_010728 [Skeletonema marinoi]|uniref:Uncharacterized protein n=1 Tax=Skeletonema marinoi TaxID=267567 RepID=A0AAD8Y365_9STRA|nr:hypothetical protein QTG54_010728 [Skeletonema marinoi]
MKIGKSYLLSRKRLHTRSKFLASVLGISKKHISIVLQETGLSTPAYPAARLLFITITCFEFHTRKTGIPAISEFGSSSAALFTVSLAPITRQTSVSSKSSLISSSSSTISYGTPASANNTLS